MLLGQFMISNLEQKILNRDFVKVDVKYGKGEDTKILYLITLIRRKLFKKTVNLLITYLTCKIII